MLRFGHDFSRVSVHSTGTGMIQTKLKINEPGDPYEQEADRVAEQVPGVQQHPENEISQAKILITPVAQRRGVEEETIQAMFGSGLTGNLQAKKEVYQNKTGIPDHLKLGLENLSSMNLSSVRVHYNSFKPAQLNALAYTQGQDIHVGPGQEKHLPHEGWHAVQQMQGRVNPTMQTKGVSINDDAGLEREAYVLGAKALQKMHVSQNRSNAKVPYTFFRSVQSARPSSSVVQRAEIDDAPEGCADLQDSAGLIDELVNGVLRAASSIQDGEDRVEFVYQQLGVGSPFTKIEKFSDALSEAYQNRLTIGETRFQGPQNPKGSNILVNAWRKGDKALGTLLNIGGICIGSDKLGHLFQQGREYFRISITLGEGDLVAEDYGRWLEGLDPDHRKSAEWIAGMSEQGWPGWDKLSSGMGLADWMGNKLGMLNVSKGVYGLATTGVFSRGDLAANRGGLDFYKAVHAGVNVTFKSREIVRGTWNERINPSCFGPTMARLVAAHDPAFHADLTKNFQKELKRVKAYIDVTWEHYERNAGVLVDSTKEHFQADMLKRAPAMARGAILRRHVPKYLCK